MSAIRPFKALYYNSEKIKDLAKVICPPYDVISDEERDQLQHLSPYNFIHVDLSKEKESDDRTNNKYIRAKETFQEWQDKGILRQDENPCFYFYKQEYTLLGEKHSRLGFTALMELQDEEGSRIYPHENTHTSAIEDRLKLCSMLKAHLSSIFVCFSDKEKKVEKIFNRYVCMTKPLVNIADNDHVRHKLWRMDDAALIHEISESMADQHFFIADGHHRYKAALEYRKMRLKNRTNPNGQEPFNYAMTYFTNIDSKDLQILPMHRIVKRLPIQNLEFLEEFFRVDKIKDKENLLILLATAGRNEKAFGLYKSDGFRLIRLKSKLFMDEYIKEGSPEYRGLDAVILKNLIFDKLGVASEEIIYTKDLPQAIEMVDTKEADCCFIMNPVKVSQLKAIALNGERMPPKTTYFYPKVLSGLTVYKME